MLSSEDIDVEKPAYLSPEHTILVYVPHPLKVSNSKHHTTQVELPVHLRYHRPSKDPDVTSAMVQLQHPNVMIRCKGMHSLYCQIFFQYSNFDKVYQQECRSDAVQLKITSFLNEGTKMGQKRSTLEICSTQFEFSAHIRMC